MIHINGQSFSIEGVETLSYEQVLHLLGHRKDRILTVVYHWRGEGDISRDGSLSPGKSVKVAEGMRFTVADTSNA